MNQEIPPTPSINEDAIEGKEQSLFLKAVQFTEEFLVAFDKTMLTQERYKNIPKDAPEKKEAMSKYSEAVNALLAAEKKLRSVIKDKEELEDFIEKLSSLGAEGLRIQAKLEPIKSYVVTSMRNAQIAYRNN